MGIPLAALHVDTAGPSPLAQYAQLQAIQGSQQQQQLREQQIQGAQQENQMRQLQLQDQQTLRTSAKGLDWSQPDTFDKWITNAQEKGVSPQTLSQLALQRATYKEQLAKTDTATLTADSQRNEQLVGHLDAIEKGADPKAQASQILSGGLVKDPAMVQKIQSIASGQYTPQKDELEGLKMGLLDHKTQADLEIKDREATAKETEATAAAQNSKNTATKLQAELPGGAMENPEQKFLRIQSAASEGKPVTADEQAFLKSYRANKTMVPAFNFSLQTNNPLAPGGGAGGGGGNNPQPTNQQPNKQAEIDYSQVPAQIKGNVKAILEYRSPMPPQSRNNPINVATRAWVQKLAPDYEETDFPAKNKILQDYTSGKTSTQINAVNTAIGHLGELDQAIDALKNNKVQVLNKVANFYNVQSGDTPVTTFNNIVHKVGPELAAAYIQGGGGEGERGTNQADYDPKMSAEQLHANTAEAIKLLTSKTGSLENQWNQTYQPRTESAQFSNRFLTPAAKQAIARVSGNTNSGSGTVMMKAPNGQMKSVPADQVEHYKSQGAAVVE